MPTACKPNKHINQPESTAFHRGLRGRRTRTGGRRTQAQVHRGAQPTAFRAAAYAPAGTTISAQIVAKHYADIQREREKFGQNMYGERFFDRLTEMMPGVPPQLLQSAIALRPSTTRRLSAN